MVYQLISTLRSVVGCDIGESYFSMPAPSSTTLRRLLGNGGMASLGHHSQLQLGVLTVYIRLFESSNDSSSTLS